MPPDTRSQVSYDPAKRILKRIAGGETPDLIICGASALEDMTKQGKIVAETSRLVARCGVGIAVRTGAPKPDISSVEAFKRTLLNAKSVAYTQEGASGIHFAGQIERLGIAEQIKSKAVRQPGGLVGELVAAGKAELAVQQIPELMAVPGVELVGPLPAGGAGHHRVRGRNLRGFKASRRGARVAGFPVDARLCERAQGQGVGAGGMRDEG